MGISIKNPETERLARALTELTGESMTTAITEALRERVLRKQREHSYESRLRRANEIVDDLAKRLKDMPTSEAWDDLSYDEIGLPK
jgi:antitoxin VapB